LIEVGAMGFDRKRHKRLMSRQLIILKFLLKMGITAAAAGTAIGLGVCSGIGYGIGGEVFKIVFKGESDAPKVNVMGAINDIGYANVMKNF